MHLHLHHEAKQWPNADYFLDTLPDTPYDISSPVVFDESIVPGPKSVIGTLSADSIICLRLLYSKLYLEYGNQFQEGQISISSTFRKYSSITWRGKSLTSTLNQNARNPFVFVAPTFSFASGIHTEFADGEAGRN